MEEDLQPSIPESINKSRQNIHKSNTKSKEFTINYNAIKKEILFQKILIANIQKKKILFKNTPKTTSSYSVQGI